MPRDDVHAIDPRRATIVIAWVLVALVVAGGCSRSPDARQQVIGKWQHTDSQEVMEFFKDGTATAYYPKPQEAKEVVGTYAFVADDRMKVEYKGRDPYIATVTFVGDGMTLKFADGRTGTYKRVP